MTIHADLPHYQAGNVIYHVTTSTFEGIKLDSPSRKIVYDSVLYFYNVRYDLYIFSVMPDHLHILLRPLMGETGFYTLGEIMKSIKSFSARKINEKRGLKGQVWNHDYFDRRIRGKEDYRAVWCYISENPVKECMVEHWMDYEFTWFKDKEKADKRTFVRYR